MQVRMTEDLPGQGHFLAALDSFASRTCYGNAGGRTLFSDHTTAVLQPYCTYGLRLECGWVESVSQ